MPAATTLFAKETNFQLCSYRQSSSRHSQAAIHDTHTRRTRHIVSIPAAFAGCGVSTSGSNETMVPFQSPQPSGAATAQEALTNRRVPISIPAALGGCDPFVDVTFSSSHLFQSPQPSGAATDAAYTFEPGQEFQSPQPSGAATATYCSIANLATISLRHYARVSRVNDSFCWQLDYTGANPTRKR